MTTFCAYDRCGKPLVKDNPRAKYCGSPCRGAASTARSKGVPGVPRTLPGELLAQAPVQDDSEGVHAAVLDELVALDRAATPLGRAALALAARIDRAMDTGSALASTVKQLEATMTAATAGAAVAKTSADELRARRDAKRHSA